MGKVIRIADWKKRKAQPDPLGRGKTYVYSPNQDPRAGMDVRTTTDEQEDALKRIKALLERSIQSDREVYQRPTVQGRETAAINSLDYHMQAVGIAKEYGLTIRRRETGVGAPKVFEVMGFGQILTVR